MTCLRCARKRVDFIVVTKTQFRLVCLSTSVNIYIKHCMPIDLLSNIFNTANANNIYIKLKQYPLCGSQFRTYVSQNFHQHSVHVCASGCQNIRFLESSFGAAKWGRSLKEAEHLKKKSPLRFKREFWTFVAHTYHGNFSISLEIHVKRLNWTHIISKRISIVINQL